MEDVTKLDMLSFFDKNMVALLSQEILPSFISRSSKTHHGVRLWVAECGTGEIAVILALVCQRLLSSLRSSVPLHIFATDRNEAHLSIARRAIVLPTRLSPFSDEEMMCHAELSEQGYRIADSVRKLITFGRLDPFHDSLLAHLDLIVCGGSLSMQVEASQQRFFSQIAVSLTPRGFFVCCQQDRPVLDRWGYIPVSKDLPIYHPPASITSADSGLRRKTVHRLEQEQVLNRLRALLQPDYNLSDAHGEDRPGLGHVSTSSQLSPAIDMLTRLAPIGMVILSHRYEVLLCNRAASKLLLLKIGEGEAPDFFHAVPGLPYQQVRAAIDRVIREGTSQVLSDVELLVAAGGNGRVLSFEMYSLPTEIGTPARIALYVHDITMQTVQQKIQEQQAKTIQVLSTAEASLKAKYSHLERAYEHLRETSQYLVSDYERLLAELTEAHAECSRLEQEGEELRAEIAVLNEQLDS